LSEKIAPQETGIAIYSTFFNCEPQELLTGFPGWKPPLPQPVIRKRSNPFSGEEILVETREPNWENMEPVDLPIEEVGVVAAEGDYGSYLEQRIPQFVRSVPHWCSKNLTQVELDPLIIEATGLDDSGLETPLFAHPSLGVGIGQVPDSCVQWLKAADESTLVSIAERWAAKMSSEEFTHSVTGDRVADDWTPGEAIALLEPIADLARRITGSQGLYLLVE